VAAFLERRDIGEALTERDEKRLLAELQSGYKSYLDSALDLIGDGSQYIYSGNETPAQVSTATVAVDDGIGTNYADVVARYLEEGERGAGWVAKTYNVKRTTLALLGELTVTAPLAPPA